MDLHRQRLNPYALVNPPPPESVERFPQWTHDETRELLAIRAQLDRSFTETKRNKPLWEATSSMLQQKGFFRTPDQCKSKWKNLVTRFKGIESAEGEIGKQFPFYEEMRRIFSDRMERLLVFEKEKGKGVQVRIKEWEEEAEEDEEEEEEEGKAEESKKRRKVTRKKNLEGEVTDALREFMRRQLEMEARWAEAAEAREAERRTREEEWRRVMESLQEERMEMEKRWREREEERRAREEARAERRHALVMALLDKLAQKYL
ncbi:hypothetical protein OPV22_013307 [Ensete ventricosum]|uniref:Myb-like domain-containing protein n=1 Tax=Ensete ventricosum TaxID=4639 RepID=A0AAV8R3J5_ENSVE|nr:hypothetical protein OPV22_013307 [Ensete ventricosum]